MPPYYDSNEPTKKARMLEQKYGFPFGSVEIVDYKDVYVGKKLFLSLEYQTFGYEAFFSAVDYLIERDYKELLI